MDFWYLLYFATNAASKYFKYSWLLLGEETSNNTNNKIKARLIFSSFEISLNKLFYYTFGTGTASEFNIYYQMLFQFFFIIVSMLFFFLLTKMLISMVIIRYRYLRSLKQLRNEAMARIMSKKSKEFKQKIVNLILFKRKDMA